MTGAAPTAGAATGAAVGLDWERCEPPLAPVAVVGLGPAVPALAAAARQRMAAGTVLRAAADGDALVVLGDAGDLPWAADVRYLGWDGGVLVPTTARPRPSAALWRDALTGPGTSAPFDHPLLVLLPPNLVLTAELPTRPADPAALAALAARATTAAPAAPAAPAVPHQCPGPETNPVTADGRDGR
ncbi:hypothetical protein [Kitasatospora sp. NPDC088134]|uniref:bpX5 domain-containing protein n=1 Tax=Kitasatospora sp. NPDC088134 TaxID=3364071 RepID=UPI00381BEE3B